MKTALQKNETSIANVIFEWNLEKVKAKMAKEGYSDEQLNQLEVEYKRFLILVTHYSTALPISSTVDEMWHTHIMFTRDYAKLGEAVGNFIHHEPVIDEKRRHHLIPAYQETLRLYEVNWGKPDPKYWTPNDCVCDPEGEGNDDTGGMW